MPQITNSIKLLSINCHGLRKTQKQADILTRLTEKKIRVVCLQDTHLIESDVSTEIIEQ